MEISEGKIPWARIPGMDDKEGEGVLLQ